VPDALTTEVAAPSSTEGGAAPPHPSGLVDAAALSKPRRTLVPLPRPVRRLAGPVSVLIVWQLLGSLGILSDRVLAPPRAVLSAGWELARTGELGNHLLASLTRVTSGLAIGVSAGVALAVVAGLFRLGDEFLAPLCRCRERCPRSACC
jgi:sulfonate transport system permease protein